MLFPNSFVDTDANGHPIYGDAPFSVSKDLTINASGATVNPPIFTITGSVLIEKIWGEIITDLSSNHTAAALRLNDQTSQIYLTAVGGTALSSLKAGSIIIKDRLVATAISKIDNVAGAVLEAAAIQTKIFTPIIITKKTGATTQIEYKYTSSNTPATGVIRFHVSYQPLSSDGAIAAV